MAKRKEELPVFRSLITTAVQHAWYHRELWPVAAVAGIAGIGAGLNDILTQARLSSALPSADPLLFLTSIAFVRDVLTGMILNGPHAILITSILALVIGTLCVLIIAYAQHIVLRASHHVLTQKAPLSVSELLNDAMHPRILRILIIDVFIKILIVNGVLATGMGVAFLRPEHSFFDAFFGIIFATSMIFIAFLLNIWGMLALIAVVKHNVSPAQALTRAWRLMRTHTLACIELSLILFAILFAMTLLAIAGLILIGTLTIPLFGILISQGTLTGMAVLSMCTILIATLWSVAWAGFAGLLMFLAWTGLVEAYETKKTPAPSRILHHSKRTMTHLFG